CARDYYDYDGNAMDYW
nr:immunoglobulin heavy chain junction region [Mus musculus]MBK4196450.1 immunoglobulin heavy chain junction region [Mus musculus]